MSKPDAAKPQPTYTTQQAMAVLNAIRGERRCGTSFIRWKTGITDDLLPVILTNLVRFNRVNIAACNETGLTFFSLTPPGTTIPRGPDAPSVQTIPRDPEAPSVTIYTSPDKPYLPTDIAVADLFVDSGAEPSLYRVRHIWNHPMVDMSGVEGAPTIVSSANSSIWRGFTRIWKSHKE